MTTQVKQDSKAPYQFLPPLTDEEYQALKADVADHGILVPVEVDEAGIMLDGHHRVKAWSELRAEGIKVPDYPRLIRAELTEAQKRNHVRSLNLLRRHLTAEQLKEQMNEMRKDGATLEKIAQTTGKGIETARRHTRSTFPNGKVEGKDKKKRPAKYKPRQPKTVIATDSTDEQKALSATAAAGGALPNKVITTKRAERIGREQDNAKRRQELERLPQTISPCDDIELRIGDFRQRLTHLKPDTIDLIFTDPPYSNGYLSLWQSLAEFAVNVLKPGGWLITYSGQTYLDEVIAAIASKLEYVWVIAQLNSAAAKTIVHRAKIYSQWKPILVFAKPPITPLDWVNDLIQGGGRDKTLHDCQQSESEAIYCIKSFSLPGQLVIDPFLGSGTTAIASKKLGRRFIGCDIDPANISKAIERINGKN